MPPPCTAMPARRRSPRELTRFADPPNTTTPGAAAGQSAAVAQATATPAGNSAQTAAATIPQLLSSAATSAAARVGRRTDLPWPLSLVYNTINDFLTMGLPTPTNNWIGLSSTWYSAILKQTLQAYFGVGVGNFGWSIGQQAFNGPLGTTAGAGGALHPVTGICRPRRRWLDFFALGGRPGVGAPGVGEPGVGHQGRPAVGTGELGLGAPGAAEQGATKVMSTNFVDGASGAPGQ